jgi:hypothetical protein
MVVPDGEASRLIAVRNLMMFEKGLIICGYPLLKIMYIYTIPKEDNLIKMKTRIAPYIGIGGEKAKLHLKSQIHIKNRKKPTIFT